MLSVCYKALKIIAIILLLGIVVLEFMRWYAMVFQPADLDFVESWHAYCAQQACLNGEHVGNFLVPPFNTLPYGPVFYIFNGFFSGYSEDLLFVRFCGRLLSLTSTLASAMMIYFLIRNLGGSLLGGILGTVVFLGAYPIQMMAVGLRPDSLACFFVLSGVLSWVVFNASIAAGVLLGLAIMAKTSYAVGAAVIVGYMVYQRQWTALLRFSVGLFAMILAICLIASMLLGSYWWQGGSFQSLRGANFKQSLFFLSDSFKGVAIIPLAIGVGSFWVFNTPKIIRYLSVYFLVSFILNFFASAKVGAAHNYYLEALAVGAVLTGYWFSVGVSRFDKNMRQALLGVTIFVLSVGIVQSGVRTSHSLRDRHDAYDQSRLVNLLQRTEGPVLGDSSWIYFASGHQPWANPADFMKIASNHPKVDLNHFTKLLQQQYFDVIVVRTNWREFCFFPEECIRVIEQRYRKYEIVDDHFVFFSDRVKK